MLDRAESPSAQSSWSAPATPPETAYKLPITNYSITNSCAAAGTAALPVYLSQHNVNAADGGDHIGDEPAFAHFGQRLQVHIRGRAHVHAVGLGGAVADHVVAHFAARRFDCLVNLARGHGKALGDDLEVVDESFHLRLHLFALGEHYLGRVGLDAALGEASQCLLHNFVGLAQFLDAHHVTGEHIAFGAQRHLKLKLVVGRVRHVATQVPIHSGGAQGRPGGANGYSIIGRKISHVFRALHPDGVGGQQALILIHSSWKTVGKMFNALKEAQRRLQGQATHAEVGGHHALAAHHLENAQQVFALAEAVEEHRHGADIERVRAQPYQVGVDAGQLVEHYPNPLGAGWNFQAQQLLHRQYVAK